MTASTVGDVVTLSFDFVPSISLSTFEAYEIAGSFVATATGAIMVSIGILLGGQTLVGDSLVGHNVADAGGLLAEDALGSGFFAPGSSIGPAALAGLVSNLFDWASFGETNDFFFLGGPDNGPGTVVTEGFDIMITLERDALPDIPLPASLPILLAGLGGLGLLSLGRRA